MKTPCLVLQLLAAASMASAGLARAESLHGSPGLAGSMVGYAKSLGPNLTLRADLMSSLAAIARESIDEGASHSGHIKSDRGALFMDWYLAGPVRLTGGMTFNRTRVDLRAGAHGAAPMLGDVPYSTALNDRFDVALRSPQTLPYLGVGYGHTGAGGSTFLFDVGGSFGRETPNGPSLAAASQTALDHELAQVRDGIGRVRFVPQVSLGMTLRF